MVSRLKTRTLAVAASAVTAMGLLFTACERPSCQAPYSCPGPSDGGTVLIDCLPPGDGAPECAGQCHAWMTENCPNVTFLY